MKLPTKTIEQEYVRVQALKEQLDEMNQIEQFWEQQHKEDREWNILGSLERILKKADILFPEYAQKGEAPDFLLTKATGEPISAIEVVEVLDPRRRRHSDYKARVDQPPDTSYDVPYDPLACQWEPLAKCIASKSLMSYSNAVPVTLLIYYNVWSFATSDWSTPFADRLLEQLRTDPSSIWGQIVPSNLRWASVLVLSSGMNCVCEISPNSKLIAQEEISAEYPHDSELDSELLQVRAHGQAPS